MTEIPNQLAGGQFAGLAGGIVAVIAIFIALFSVVLLVPIILIVANRAEPDPRGQRSHSVYLFGMSFVTLQLTFAGSVLIVTSLFSVIAPHVVPLTNSIARSVVIGGLLVVLFGAMLLLHLGRGIETARGDGALTGPNLRVMQSYAGVVGFIYLLRAHHVAGRLHLPALRVDRARRLRQLRLQPQRHPGHAARPGLRHVGVGLRPDGPLLARAVRLPRPPAAGRGPDRPLTLRSGWAPSR